VSAFQVADPGHPFNGNLLCSNASVNGVTLRQPALAGCVAAHPFSLQNLRSTTDQPRLRLLSCQLEHSLP
jgi:hypothetical protein